MGKTLSLSFTCGCALAHNAKSSENTTVSLCKDHVKSETAIAAARKLTEALKEFQVATGN